MPRGFRFKDTGLTKTGPKSRTVCLKKKARALFDVVWSAFSADLPCVSARTSPAAGLKRHFPHALGMAARPKSASPSCQKSRGFRLKGLVCWCFSHAFCLGKRVFFKNTMLLTSFSLSVWAVRLELGNRSILELLCKMLDFYVMLVWCTFSRDFPEAFGLNGHFPGSFGLKVFLSPRVLS